MTTTAVIGAAELYVSASPIKLSSAASGITELTHVKPNSFKLLAFNPDKQKTLLAAAYTVNTLAPLIFSTLLFSNCTVEQPAALNIISFLSLSSLSLIPLFALLKVNSKYRLREYLESGKAVLSVTGYPHEINPTNKCIVDSKHAMVIGSQLINCSLACAVGGIILTEKCEIDLIAEPISPAILMICFNLCYVLFAVKAGGSIRV